MDAFNKQELKKDIKLAVGTSAISTPSKMELHSIISDTLDDMIEDRRISIDDDQKKILIEEIEDDISGLGPIQKFLEDEHITEIMINGPYQIYIESKGIKTLSDKTFDDEDHLRSSIEKMLKESGRRLDERSPFVDFSLSDGSRVNAIIPPLSVDGTTVTIRKFLETIASLNDLVDFKTIDKRIKDFLKSSIKARLNILFSGATGSGKTSTLSVLANEIGDSERIITIEDALELKIDKDHVIRLLTKDKNIEDKGEITIRDLFKNTLRMRPSRLILGEIRGEEALDLLQAINSGHEGTLAVLHASTPYDAIGRLETMAMYSKLNIPASEIRRQIVSGIDIIIQHEQLTDGSRKITEIAEVESLQNGEVTLNTVFKFETDSLEADGKVTGHFNFLEKPKTDKFKKYGITF